MTAITDQMIETAAQALHHIDGTGTHPQWDLEWDYVKADYLLQARGALEAVAPLIAAQALRDAAHEVTQAAEALWTQEGIRYPGWEHAVQMMHARADQLEREAGQ